MKEIEKRETVVCRCHPACEVEIVQRSYITKHGLRVTARAAKVPPRETAWDRVPALFLMISYNLWRQNLVKSVRTSYKEWRSR